MASSDFEVRPFAAGDVERVLPLRKELWPSCPDEDHARELAAYAAGSSPELLGGALLVCADAGGAIVGFAEASLRSYAEGCESSPVGFVEGWFVAREHRGRGAGRALLAACEAWARARGCTEMGSDTEIDNAASQAAHAALGYEEVDRIVCFRKRLVDVPER